MGQVGESDVKEALSEQQELTFKVGTVYISELKFKCDDRNAIRIDEKRVTTRQEVPSELRS